MIVRRRLTPLHLLGAAVALALVPSAASAQMDPMSGGQPTASQAARQQQQPGAQASAIRNDNGLADSTGAGPGATGQEMKDKIFLRKAAEGGLAEVELGQLASQKSSDDEVKTFAQKMVTDHTALSSQLSPFADSLGVHAPKKLSAKDQAELDKLNGLSGADFDKEYLAYMVRDHHQDLREFRMEAEGTTDPALRNVVDKGATTIRQHTVMVTALARSKGVAIPGRGGAPVSSAAPTQ